MGAYRIDQLLDIPQIQLLLESHYRITGVPCGLVDADSNIVAAVGLQEICTRFHWANPASYAECWLGGSDSNESVSSFEGDCFEGCCENGMVNIFIPVVIDGRRMATFFAGQFFYNDTPPDFDLFRQQAVAFGFEQEPYLQAVRQTPVVSREHARDAVCFFQRLVRLLGENGLKNVLLSSEIAKRKIAEKRLALKSFALDFVREAAYLLDTEGNILYVNREACRSLGYSKKELEGMAIPDIDPDFGFERLAEQYEYYRKHEYLTFETRHRTRDGRIFPVEITSTLMEYDGVQYILSLVRDITERKQVEGALHFVAGRGWTRNSDSFLEALACYLGETFGVDYVDIAQLAGDEPGAAETVALYAKGAIVPNMRYPLKGTPCDDIIGKAFCYYRNDVCSLFPDDILLREMGVESYAGIPLWDSEGRALGLIALMDGKPLSNVNTISRVLHLIATSAAAAIEHAHDEARLRRSVRELMDNQQRLNDVTLAMSMAGEHERCRIATDLHDTLGQDLTLARIKLGGLTKLEMREEVRNVLDEIRVLMETAITRVRRMTHVLSPPVMESAGLEAALKWLCRQIETDYGLRVNFSDDVREKPVPAEYRMEIYSAVRELLINVAKHAGTETAGVSVHREDDEFVATVVDNGGGFLVDDTVKHPGAGGFGLFNLRRRITYMGGRVEIDTAPGRGTRASIRMPLAKIRA